MSNLNPNDFQLSRKRVRQIWAQWSRELLLPRTPGQWFLYVMPVITGVAWVVASAFGIPQKRDWATFLCLYLNPLLSSGYLVLFCFMRLFDPTSQRMAIRKYTLKPQGSIWKPRSVLLVVGLLSLLFCIALAVRFFKL